MNNSFYNLQNFREMLENDEKEIRTMLEMFCEFTPILLNEMREAAQKNQWKELGDLAHKVKSSFRLFGMNDLVEKAVEIEINGRNTENVSELQNKAETFIIESNEIIEMLKNDLNI
jgi:HPt (histidine-containing phosphotransfer) domain-containing protein